MFPAPSPNSQALYNQLANGGATPGTLDFHRTAINAAAARKNYPNPENPPQLQQKAPTSDMALKQEPQSQANGNDPFAQHDAADAANGLFMLAHNAGQQQPQYAMPNQNNNMQSMQARTSNQSQNTSPQMGKRGARNASMGGSISATSDMNIDQNSEAGDVKPNTRGKGKKGGKNQANGRRKAEETTPKSNKKSKGNNGQANVDPALEPHDSDDDSDMKDENEIGQDGKKMTDEEKRKNFLERNRYGFCGFGGLLVYI